MFRKLFSIMFNCCFLVVSVGISAATMGSQVEYSTCPGYPFASCPPGWSPVNIPDNNANGVVLELYVPHDSENFITDVNAWIYLTHAYQGDVRVVLTAPSGTSVELINRAGSPGCNSFGFAADDFGHIDGSFILREFELDDSAPTSYNSPAVGCPGINGVSGVWRPASALFALYGQSKVGVWKLFIQDLSSQDVGTLHVWGLSIRTEPATGPLVHIATPEDFASTQPNESITGTASDPDGTFAQYRLDWAVESAGPWNQIIVSTSPVTNGVLGHIPGLMPQGPVYLRLIATNVLGMSTTFVKLIETPDGCVGDMDGDGDADLLDYADFSNCMTSPGGECECP